MPEETIQSKIYLIRGQKVMLDRVLAKLYQIETKALKQAVRRNKDIFPEHFMFELTREEQDALRSQSVTSKKGRGGTRYLPMVFTEHGVLQLANVLRSNQARKMGIKIIEVFVKMRETITTHKDLMIKLEELEGKVSDQDRQFDLIFKYLKQLEQAKQQELEQRERKPIGFQTSNKQNKKTD